MTMKRLLPVLLLLVAQSAFAAKALTDTGVNDAITGRKTFSGSNILCLKDPSDTDRLCVVAPALASSTVQIIMPAIAGTLATLAGTETLTNKSIAFGQLTGLGSGVGTWLGTPTGANLMVGVLGCSGTTNFLRADGTCATPAGASPLTTKGDVYVYGATNDRLPVGTNGQVLTADSAQSLGVKWATVAGTGDVVGPASSTDGRIVAMDGATGKLIKELTAAQATATLNNAVGDSGSGGTKGLVPAPSAGDAAAGKYLKADLTWTAPSGGGGDLVKIAQVVTASSATTITFSSIPGTYSNLKIIAYGRQSTGTGERIWVSFNSDATAANYDLNHQTGAFGTTANNGFHTVSTKGLVAGELPGTASDAQAIGTVEILVPSYAQTTFQKQLIATYQRIGGTGNSTNTAVVGGRWKSTAAITSIVITSDTGSFVNGTTATLYGMN